MVDSLSSTEQLLALAREYGRAEKIPLSTVSWRVFGDNKKLGAIESGADIQTRRFEKAVEWFRDNWPTCAAWPAGVAAPAQSHTGIDTTSADHPR